MNSGGTVIKLKIVLFTEFLSQTLVKYVCGKLKLLKPGYFKHTSQKSEYLTLFAYKNYFSIFLNL